MIKIYSHKGVELVATEIGGGSKRVFTLMKDDYVNIRFSLAQAVHLPIGAYVELDGFGRFELCDPYHPTMNTKTGGWDYDVRFDAHYIKWRNKLFKYNPSQGAAELSWSLTADLATHVKILLDNLKALGYKYNNTNYSSSYDATVTDAAKLITYESTSLLDALYRMAETFECEMWVTDSVIHFGRCEAGTAVDFAQDRNVETMTAEGNRAQYGTRIYAFGSTRNLPKGYRPTAAEVTVNGVVQKRLMLPADTPYIDLNPSQSTVEAVEQILTFDDIYPRTKSAIQLAASKQYDVVDDNGNATGETWTAYRFTIPGFTFKEAYILPGTELKITFQDNSDPAKSCSLIGMTFAVRFNPDTQDENTTAGQLWEIIRNEDYGRPLPDTTLKPQDGDQIVLEGWDSTAITNLDLVAQAENELKQRAIEKGQKLKKDPVNYRCKMISATMFDKGGQWVPFTLGSRVNLVNAGCFEEGNRQSRIIGYEYDLARPFDSPIYIVGEQASVSRMSEMESKVEALTIAGQTYAAAGSGVYIIRTNDKTVPTDANVFSALRSQTEFLNKKKDDTAEGVIRLLKGLLIGQGGVYGISEEAVATFKDTVARTFDTPDFAKGDLGSGFGVYKRGELTKLEVDELLVRRIATFMKLEIRELAYVAGNIVLSNAASELSEVEPVYDEDKNLAGWKCSWVADDGKTSTTNTWMVGDQARCQTFNIAEGVYDNVSNRYYWRLVTEVGDDYIVLSADDKDTATSNDNPECIPKAGDKVVQMGYRLGSNATESDPSDDTNRDRTSLMELSTNGEDAPSIKAFSGVIDYSLSPDRRVFVISPMSVVFNSDYFQWSSGGITFPQRIYIGDWDYGTHAKYFEEYTWRNCSWLCIAPKGTDDEPALDSSDWKIIAGDPRTLIRRMRFVNEYGEFDTWIDFGDTVHFHSIVEDGLLNQYNDEYTGWTIRRHNGDTPDEVASDNVWNATRAAITDEGEFDITWSGDTDDLQAERATFEVEACLKNDPYNKVKGILKI